MSQKLIAEVPHISPQNLSIWNVSVNMSSIKSTIHMVKSLSLGFFDSAFGVGRPDDKEMLDFPLGKEGWRGDLKPALTAGVDGTAAGCFFKSARRFLAA